MRIKWSRKIVKKRALFERAGRTDVIAALDDVIRLFIAFDRQSQFILQEHYRDHPLKGHRKGMRELHLAYDDLLLYWVEHEDGTITLIDIVTHEELRKRK